MSYSTFGYGTAAAYPTSTAQVITLVGVSFKKTLF